MKFMCFGGAAAVADDGCEAAVAAAARHRGQRGRSLSSFRGQLFSSGKGSRKKPSPASPLAEARKRGADDGGGASISTASSSVASSSAPLSSAASLDSAATSLSSSSRSSSVSSSSPSAVLLPAPAPARREARTSSTAAGAAAVVLCLLTVVFCGRVGAMLLTSAALYLFPRRWLASCNKAGDGVAEPPECDAVSGSEAEEEDTAKRKVVKQGFLRRNRNK